MDVSADIYRRPWQRQTCVHSPFLLPSLHSKSINHLTDLASECCTNTPTFAFKIFFIQFKNDICLRHNK